jgi:prepilin-type N-terminal cleavage/methylation domain-containing protein
LIYKRGWFGKNRAGFTIVELLVTVAIVAVLATVLIVAFSKVTGSAKSSIDTLNVKNLNKQVAANGANGALGYSASEVRQRLIDNGIKQASLKTNNSFLLYSFYNNQFYFTAFPKLDNSITINPNPSMPEGIFCVEGKEALIVGCSNAALMNELLGLHNLADTQSVNISNILQLFNNGQISTILDAVYINDTAAYTAELKDNIVTRKDISNQISAKRIVVSESTTKICGSLLNNLSLSCNTLYLPPNVKVEYCEKLKGVNIIGNGYLITQAITEYTTETQTLNLLKMEILKITEDNCSITGTSLNNFEVSATLPENAYNLLSKVVSLITQSGCTSIDIFPTAATSFEEILPYYQNITTNQTAPNPPYNKLYLSLFFNDYIFDHTNPLTDITIKATLHSASAQTPLALPNTLPSPSPISFVLNFSLE